MRACFFSFGGRWGVGGTIHPPLTLCNGLSPMRKTCFIGLLLVSRNIIRTVARFLVKELGGGGGALKRVPMEARAL